MSELSQEDKELVKALADTLSKAALNVHVDIWDLGELLETAPDAVSFTPRIGSVIRQLGRALRANEAGLELTLRRGKKPFGD